MPARHTIDACMPFPTHRMRRLRASESLRNLVARDAPGTVAVHFPAVRGRRRRGAARDRLDAGNYQLSIDELLKECETTERLGSGRDAIRQFRRIKDERRRGPTMRTALLQQALRALKHALPKLVASPTSATANTRAMGHCGQVVDGGRGQRRDARMAGRGGGLARPRGGPISLRRPT